MAIMTLDWFHLKEKYSFKIGFYLIQHELSRSNPIVRAVKQTVLENIEEFLRALIS